MGVKFHQDGRVSRDGAIVGWWSRVTKPGLEGYEYKSAIGGSITRKLRAELIPIIGRDRHGAVGITKMHVPRKPLNEL